MEGWMSELLITREEAAETLQLSLRTVERLLATGEISVRREGKIKSDPNEAKEFLERVTVVPAKPQPANAPFAQQIINR